MPDAVFDCSRLSSRHAHTAPFAAHDYRGGRERDEARCFVYKHDGVSLRSDCSGLALFGPTCLIGKLRLHRCLPSGISLTRPRHCFPTSTIISKREVNHHVSRTLGARYPRGRWFARVPKRTIWDRVFWFIMAASSVTLGEKKSETRQVDLRAWQTIDAVRLPKVRAIAGFSIALLPSDTKTQ